MRTKALILGAKPPFEGPWVPLDEGVVWRSYVETNPPVQVNEGVSLVTVDLHGSVTLIPLGDVFEGLGARAILKEIEGNPDVSIFVREVKE
jgi:hypothetical protein